MDALSKLPEDWVLTSGQFTKTAHSALYPAIDPTRPENSLRGKTVLVTGASRGIGAKGMAPAFAWAGAGTVILLATDVAKLADVREKLVKINPDLEIVVVGADISSAEEVEQAWSVIKAKCPKVHVLVNNAGVESGEGGKMMHEQDADIFFKNFVCDSAAAPFASRENKSEPPNEQCLQPN